MYFFSRKFFATTLILIFSVLVLNVPSVAFAAPRDLVGEASANLNNTTDRTGIRLDDVGTFVGKVISPALATVGSVFFLLMIYAGFLWMTARGDESQIEKAKELIKAAIIGLAVVVSAYALTAFFTSRLT